MVSGTIRYNEQDFAPSQAAYSPGCGSSKTIQVFILPSNVKCADLLSTGFRFRATSNGDRPIRGRRPRVEPDALQPNQQRFPMDARNDFECQERINDEGARERGVGQILPDGVQPGDNERPIAVAANNRNRHIFSRRHDGERIDHIGGHEGRDVERFPAFLRDRHFCA